MLEKTYIHLLFASINRNVKLFGR